MSEQPIIKVGDWITINRGTPHCYDAVVTSLNPLSEKYPNSIEIIYLEKPSYSRNKKPPKQRAFNTYVIWNNNRWERLEDYFYDGYADTFDRLAEFVSILRRGRY